MAAGTRLLPKRALLHLRDLYLCPKGSTVKWRLSGCVMSCATVFAMHVMALQLSFKRLGVGTYYLGSSVGYVCKFDPVCDRECVEETGGAVEQDGLNNALVYQ